MSQDVDESHIAMVRGVKNCGKHHEENEASPAILFADKCDGCAGRVFAVIYNAGVQAMMKEAVHQVRMHQR
jgi:hypothetical protein